MLSALFLKEMPASKSRYVELASVLQGPLTRMQAWWSILPIFLAGEIFLWHKRCHVSTVFQCVWTTTPMRRHLLNVCGELVVAIATFFSPFWVLESAQE